VRWKIRSDFSLARRASTTAASAASRAAAASAAATVAFWLASWARRSASLESERADVTSPLLAQPEAEHLERALATNVADAFLLTLRDACQTVLTAIEAIDPNTEILLEQVQNLESMQLF
jgi:hypothetical protein